MNRRQFLVSAAAIPQLAKAMLQPSAPLAMTHEVTVPIHYLEQFEIIYPDGSVWTFAGFITNQSETEISIRPQGPMTLGSRHEIVSTRDRVPPNLPSKATGTMISRNGGPQAELRDITLPQLTRSHVYNESYVGLRKTGEITFCGKFL